MSKRFKSGDIIQYKTSQYTVLGYGNKYGNPWSVEQIRQDTVLWVGVEGKFGSMYFPNDRDYGLILVKAKEVKSNKPAWF